MKSLFYIRNIEEKTLSTNISQTMEREIRSLKRALLTAYNENRKLLEAIKDLTHKPPANTKICQTTPAMCDSGCQIEKFTLEDAVKVKLLGTFSLQFFIKYLF